MSNRRDFLKKMGVGAASLAFTGPSMALSAKSYGRVMGANDRLQIGLIGLGRRYGAYIEAISDKKNNVDLVYLCDVMDSQRVNAAKHFANRIDNKPKLINDLHTIMDDKEIDVIFNSTPDHWHTPAAVMGAAAGKQVYLEKPCSHDMAESEMLMAAQKKYGTIIQMGNQQRSDARTIKIIKDIHNGRIGVPFKAIAFYSANRGRCPNPVKAPVPQGLDWNLFQGPAIHHEYMADTWDYNWHWYGWNFGTGEFGNNATHELDVARWALQVTYPERVDVAGFKTNFIDDGWVMYDSMDATFKFPNNKVIKWDGESRNRYMTYGSGRGTIIYGTEGSVFVNRNCYRLYDRDGKLIEDSTAKKIIDGTKLGGGGDSTTDHVRNFFDTIRGKGSLNSPISEGVISQAMTHYGNLAYRVNKGFDVDAKTGRIYDREAMKLWGREYEPGWEPKF